MSGRKPPSTAREMLREPRGRFLVFETTHLTMKAEKILKEADIPHRLFPKPKSVISECGLVIKVLEEDLERAVEICKGRGVAAKETITIGDRSDR